MGVFAKIFGVVPREVRGGIHLDETRPFWEVSGKTDFPDVFAALPALLPPDCILYFEGGAPSRDLARFLREHSVPERAHVAYGTIWPKPPVFHLPAHPETIGQLKVLMQSRDYAELAIHFHVYRDQTILLEWHDAFTEPMLISGEFSEEQVGVFAERLKMSHNKRGV